MSTQLTGEMRRSLLIAALRDQTLWPPGFAWYFGNCRTCAMGLLNNICKLGLPMTYEESRNRPGTAPWVETVAESLGLDREKTKRIFDPGGAVCLEVYGTDIPDKVRPEMVAAELERVHQKMKEEVQA